MTERTIVSVTSEREAGGNTYWVTTTPRATRHTTRVRLAHASPSSQGDLLYEVTGDDAGAQARHDAAVRWVEADCCWSLSPSHVAAAGADPPANVAAGRQFKVVEGGSTT